MQIAEQFPTGPGTYILFLLLRKSKTITVGRLGSWTFRNGYYAYTGSAQGSGGLAGRLKRHLRPDSQKRIHWHIDHLVASDAKITQVWWKEGQMNHECFWAQQLAKEGSIVLPGFGSSDCTCPSHLIWLPALKDQPPNWKSLKELLGDNIKSLRVNTE